MILTGPDVRVLQLHPTRFCNLRCLHCYSSSGPEQRAGLRLPLLLDAIRHSAALGYNVLSISGGEPVLYPQLRQLCEEARRNAMVTTLVTNGTVLNEDRVASLSGVVDALAISIDGAPERHNRIRRHAAAFELMEARLPLLRHAGIPFAFVFTLTSGNLAELEWAADFAVEQGAAMLQVHPIERHGRAVSQPEMQSLTGTELSFAALVVDCLRKIHERKLVIQFDALNRRRLPVKPEEVMSYCGREISEILSPLVIEDDGTVVPMRYGFPRNFALGNLNQTDLNTLSSNWRRQQACAFCDLYAQLLGRIQHSAFRFVNFYQLLAEAAEANQLAMRATPS